MLTNQINNSGNILTFFYEKIQNLVGEYKICFFDSDTINDEEFDQYMYYLFFLVPFLKKN